MRKELQDLIEDRQGKPWTVATTARLDVETYLALMVLARRLDQSMSLLINRLLKLGVEDFGRDLLNERPELFRDESRRLEQFRELILPSEISDSEEFLCDPDRAIERVKEGKPVGYTEENPEILWPEILGQNNQPEQEEE